MLRNEALEHLREHPYLYKDFVARNYEKYTEEMAKDGTYGDHTTLLAISRVYVQILILSAADEDNWVLVSPSGEYCDQMSLLTLGHILEGMGAHSVSV